MSSWHLQHFEVDVAYYDEEHQRLLGRAPYPTGVKDVVKSSPIKVETSEFLAYFLFRLLGREEVGIRSYQDALAAVDSAKDTIRTFLVQNHNTITVPKQSHPVKEVIEGMGVSLGLSVVSRIYKMTQADWTRIEEGRKASFDFGIDAIASTGSQYVKVETKGSIVDDNRRKRPNISEHKSDIAKKKEKLGYRKDGSKPRDVLYGTIGVADRTGTNRIRCWLLDPEVERTSYDPAKYRILARLVFLYQWSALISPYSKVTWMLRDRIEEIRGEPKWRRFSKRRLFDDPGPDSRFLPDGYFRNKSYILGREIGGLAFILKDGTTAFLGVSHRLVELAIAQNFDAILKYSQEPGLAYQDAQLVFPRSHWPEKFNPRGIEGMERSGDHWQCRRQMAVYSSSSGIVLGFEQGPAEIDLDPESEFVM